MTILCLNYALLTISSQMIPLQGLTLTSTAHPVDQEVPLPGASVHQRLHLRPEQARRDLRGHELARDDDGVDEVGRGPALLALRAQLGRAKRKTNGVGRVQTVWKQTVSKRLETVVSMTVVYLMHV